MYTRTNMEERKKSMNVNRVNAARIKVIVLLKYPTKGRSA